MNTTLCSDNISLLFGDDFIGYNTMDELWRAFRRTAVEPGQSSTPDFTSFSDDCLLCARIVKNDPPLVQNENENHGECLWDPEEPIQGTSSALPIDPPPTPSQATAGLIYLHAGPANLPAGEANIGIIIKPDMQRRGYAREAVQLVLRWAFEELKFHRVQAAILDTPDRDRALRLFIGSGFVHEGTRRRAVYQPEGEGMAGVWKDVTYTAMLDTEWMLKSTLMRANHVPQPPIVSVWDEMFARHAKEREELAQWEEKHGRTRRSASTETLKNCTRNAAQDIAYLTDDASSLGGSVPPSPRLNVLVNWEEDTHMADDLGPDELHQRWEDVVETSLVARRHKQWMASASLDPSVQDHMLALPSIPSRLSEGNPQSPLTIPSSFSPGSTPPFSPSPSSSAHSTWSGAEDEDNWLPREDLAHARAPIPSTAPHTGSVSLRTRSRSSSVASSNSDSWSDAQSSIGASSSSWDVVSDGSDRNTRGHA